MDKYSAQNETGVIKTNSGTSSITNELINALGGTTVWNPYSIFNPANILPTVYSPGRPLPRDENGIPVPETDAPHTQLGTREGGKENYPQAREFDPTGNPVKDIDFTNHGIPAIHPNPHEHRYEENPSGRPSPNSLH